jgi:hypothetical protein
MIVRVKAGIARAKYAIEARPGGSTQHGDALCLN